MLTTLTPAEVRARKQLDELRDRLASDQAAPFADVSREATQRRHRETRGQVGKWARTYAPHHAESPDAAFHRDVDAMFGWPRLEVHGVHGPRDHAKSTRAMLNVLEGLCNGTLRYWLNISETLGLAVDRCLMLDIELTENHRLRQDYEVKALKSDESRGIWEYRVTQRATGQAHTVRVLAASWRTPVKGKLWRGKRPCGALIDDFESTETSRNQDISDRKVDWVIQEVYPACLKTVVWLGNTGRKTSALYRFARQVFDEKDDALKAFLRAGTTPGSVHAHPEGPRPEKRQANRSEGKSRPEAAPDRPPAAPPTARAALRFWSFRATTQLPDGATRYLWPERYGPEWYAVKLATLKRRRFSGEMNGEPIAVGKIFLAEWFPTYKRLPEGDDLRAYLWCDPAFGRSASSCYKAVVVVATDGRRYYVVDAWLRQSEPVIHMIGAMYALFLQHEAVGLRHGGAEQDFAQDQRLERDLDDAADEHGYPLPIGFDRNPGNKEGRIESLEGLMSAGRVLWPEPGGGHDHNEQDVATLKDQFLGYPDDYDDGPDATESAIRRIRFTRGSRPFYQSQGKRRHAPRSARR